MARINKLKYMKKLFSIPLMLLATLMMATACSEDEPMTDGQEQTTPEKMTGKKEEMWTERTDATLSFIAPAQATRNVWHRLSSPHWTVI